jgi:hypothetical protein
MSRRKTLRAERVRRATAHHEAGHAVMAWALGLTVESVSIKPHRNSHGRVMIDVPRWVSHGDPADPVVRLWAEANIISQMSGFVAERRYRGRANHVGALADYANTYETASALTFSRRERDLFLDWLFARACSLMRRLSAQRAVNAVARVLLEKERISGRTVARIANRAWQA